MIRKVDGESILKYKQYPRFRTDYINEDVYRKQAHTNGIYNENIQGLFKEQTHFSLR